MDFYLADLQAAFFTPRVDMSNKLYLASEIIKATENLFDPNPLMIDLPPDTPLEIPRIVLKSSDRTYELHIGLNRFDFYYHDRKATLSNSVPESKLEDTRILLLDKIKVIAIAIKKVTGVKITRLGVVPTLIGKVE